MAKLTPYRPDAPQGGGPVVYVPPVDFDVESGSGISTAEANAAVVPAPRTPIPGTLGALDAEVLPQLYQPARATREESSVHGPEIRASFSFVDVTYSVPDAGARRGRGTAAMSESSLSTAEWGSKRTTLVGGESLSGRTDLIRDFSGAVFPKELLAILGPSGSGKTVLLNVLAGRTSGHGRVEGEILLNGRPASAARRRSLVSYVARETSFLGDFTVFETLMMAGGFHFGLSMKDEIKERVEALIDLVGLATARDTMVGSIFRRGLSGGQKRRLSIALELISSPSVIIIDEPTSGLDSSSAYAMLMNLRKIVSKGHSMIISLNQPTSHCWQCLDLITVVGEGRQIYFGRVEDAMGYFQTTYDLACPAKTNPSDFIISFLMFESRRKQKTIEQMAFGFQDSEANKIDLSQRIQDARGGRLATKSSSAKPSTGDGEGVPDERGLRAEPKNSGKNAGVVSGFLILAFRNLMSLWRNPGVIIVRLVIFISLGCVFGIVYPNVGKQFTTAGVRATISVLLCLDVFYVFLSICAIPFIIEERLVFSRERENGAYATSAYVLARLFVVLISSFVLAITVTILTCYTNGFRNFDKVLLPMWLVLTTAEIFVMLIGAMVSHFMTGIAIAALCYGILILVGGFFIPFNSLLWVLRWAAYVNPLWYNFRCLMRNQFEGGVYDSPLYPSGAAVLDSYDVEMAPIGYWGDIGILCAFVAAYAICFGAVMTRKV